MPSIPQSYSHVGAGSEAEQKKSLFHWCFCIYLFFVLARPQDFPVLDISWPILAILQAIIMIVWLTSKPRPFGFQQYLLLMMSVWMFVSLIRVGFGVAYEESFTFLTSKVIIFFFICDAASEKSGKLAIIRTLLVATTIIAIHGILQMQNGELTGFSGQTALPRTSQGETIYQMRYVGIFGDPNDTGMILLIGLPFAVFFYNRAASSIPKLMWFSILAVHVYGIYLTNSRGSLVGLAALIATWLAVKYNMIKGLILLAIVSPILMRFAPSRFSISNDEATQDRIDAWFEGLQMLKAYPIQGVGVGGFRDWHHRAAHNSYIQVLSEIGLIGYAMWTALIFSAVYFAFQHQRDTNSQLPNSVKRSEDDRKLSRALFLSLVAALTTMFFLSRGYHLPIFLLTALTVDEYVRNKANYSISPGQMIRIIIGSILGTIAAIYLVIRTYT